MQSVIRHVQARLNAGETQGFIQGRESVSAMPPVNPYTAGKAAQAEAALPRPLPLAPAGPALGAGMKPTGYSR